MVLHTKTAKAATLDILTTHCIPAAMSDDLKTWVKNFGEGKKIAPSLGVDTQDTLSVAVHLVYLLLGPQICAMKPGFTLLILMFGSELMGIGH